MEYIKEMGDDMFQGKVCVITGGAKGIGRCLVEEFSKLGCSIAFIDKDETAGQKVLTNLSGNHLFIAGDLAKKEDIEKFANQVIQKYGSIDFLLNNACFSNNGIISDCSYEDFTEVLNVGGLLLLVNPHRSDEVGILLLVKADKGREGMTEQTVIQVGQEFPLTIKRLGINGEGVGFFKRNVIFVKGALPGEVITAQVTEAKAKYAEAKIKKIRQASPDRVVPQCPVYEACGGCQLQHMSYGRQLIEKRDLVIQALERYVKDLAPTIDVKQTIGMDNPLNYRNKSQFQVRSVGNKVIAGLYAESSNKLIDINECIMQHPVTPFLYL